MGWMYHIILGKDVYVVQVKDSALSDRAGVEQLDCVWFDEKGGEWLCQPLCCFEPPRNH